MSEITTGELRYTVGMHYECVDCGTSFPIKEKGASNTALCNGFTITLCPWCRPDSKQWKNGRGI